MSRIGKKPIVIPMGVSIAIKDGVVLVRGPKGESSCALHRDIVVAIDGSVVTVSSRIAGGKYSALWGLWRSIVANMVHGASFGFEKKMEIEGIGYRASVDADALILQLGFSHPVRFPIPTGLTVRVEKNVITVSGIDKQAVGTVAAARDTEIGTKKSSGGGSVVAAGMVGELIAARAREKKIFHAVFDRAGYRYHGAVKAIADGARRGGLIL